MEKNSPASAVSVNHSSELLDFKSQGIMRLPNGEDKIQECTNYVQKTGSEFPAIGVVDTQPGSIKPALMLNLHLCFCKE